jgi:hypothetical protein
MRTYFSIWRLLSWNQLYNSLYVLPFFILALFLGKKVYLKLDDVLIKKIILGLLFIWGYVIDKLVTDSV